MTVLVTGGGGFVGSALVRALLERGESVRSLARGDYPALRELGAETVRGDLCDPAAVREAASGCDLVFHVAAMVGESGRPEAFEAVNIGGTRNVLDACRAEGVGRLVFTSTPSVVHGAAVLDGVDESTPYPSEHVADYPRTKAAAEALVLAAADDALRTVALRPRGIWGPGDTQLLPRLVELVRAGRLRRIGELDPKQDFTYIDNVVHAHLVAAERLGSAPGSVSGRAFFVSDDEPVPVWTMTADCLGACGLEAPTRAIPPGVARAAATVFEAAWRWTGRRGEPRVTHYKLDVFSKPAWFDITAAKRDLGYAPPVSRAEGLRRLKEWVERGGMD